MSLKKLLHEAAVEENGQYVVRNTVFPYKLTGPLDVRDYVFENCDFSHTVFSGSRISRTSFVNCNFAQANLDKSLWNAVSFTGCNLRLFRARHSCGLDMRFQDCEAHGLDFCFSRLDHLTFASCDLSQAMFTHTFMKSADFSLCGLKYGNMRSGLFDRLYVRDCDLSLINLSDSHWIGGMVEKTPMPGAMLPSFLSGMCFSHVDFSGAQMTNAVLCDVNFDACDTDKLFWTFNIADRVNIPLTDNLAELAKVEEQEQMMRELVSGKDSQGPRI